MSLLDNLIKEDMIVKIKEDMIVDTVVKVALPNYTR